MSVIPHASPPAQTVFIVDDDRGMRTSIRSLMVSAGLHSESLASAREFLERYELARSGCLLLDMRMPNMDGLELQAELNRRGIGLPVICIAGHADITMAVEAMRRGAVDFFEKPVHGESLLARVQETLARQVEAREAQRRLERQRSRMASLTEREKEILRLLTSGASNREMALTLGLSCRTIEVHRASVMRKMAATSVATLVRMTLGLDVRARRASTPHA